MNEFKGIKEKFKNRVENIDKNIENIEIELGVFETPNNEFLFRMWHPFSEEVYILIYDKNNPDVLIEKKLMINKGQYKEIILKKCYLGFYYQYEILQENGKKTIALDPYAKSLAPFNWNGKEEESPKGAIIDASKILKHTINVDLISNVNNGVDPIIYELNIRDFTSLLNQKKFKSRLGTFNAAIENNIFSYLKSLGITHIQLLPIQAIYTLNDLNLKVLNQNEGSGWTTNYNWGYDPASYFALSGWYFSNPEDPISRIIEFKNFINEAHKNGIGIILDVVYNHMMNNILLNNLVPNYYYRENSEIRPVAEPSVNSEAKMMQKIIMESLEYFAQDFGIDGFRFDLSTFIDKETLELIAIRLRKINPNIVLHGEAWKFSDLAFNNSFTKGVTTNEHKFAYFNDTLRNAIKGADNLNQKNNLGLIHGNLNKLPEFISSVVGNIRGFNWNNEIKYSNDSYDLFANEASIALQYAACHDGFTLWDKIQTTINDSFEEKINRYRQALLMHFTCQGRQLILAGTELLQTKPIDKTGEEWIKSNEVLNKEDSPLIKDGNFLVHENSYKTTDYTNGIKWNHLKNEAVNSYVFDFLKKLIKFRKETEFFRLNSTQEINEKLSFIPTKSKGLVTYKIKDENEKSIIVCHNFSDKKFELDFTNEYKVFLNSRFTKKAYPQKIEAHTSIIFVEK